MLPKVPEPFDVACPMHLMPIGRKANAGDASLLLNTQAVPCLPSNKRNVTQLRSPPR